MLHKWKFILTNWINCYFNESDKKEHVTLESLLTIISHLRENLNLNESKSSILEAHTLEEFLVDKFPEFKFENGTIEATSEEEIYIMASLLLYFVCVNSKDVDIKTAMCSKLIQEDQETILKFSKCLMECSPISYRDVQAAITEACCQDIAGGENHVKVAETPPALRSLHSEVRRLQASLDAERFDRNYLQEELARTNLRLEKLVKEKEQWKLDIMNLKAKLSLCGGQEAEARGDDAAADSSARLTRQLQEMEERLVVTQGELDDVQYQRDTYKTKVDELKKERDKWLTASQEENTRADQLAEELETERRNVLSLRELVTELRQHVQKTCLDSSQLECDDPDASIPSLHNASVCSEACANVVEVQLGEERAKIVVLKQQIQYLQDQLNNLTEKAESEKLLYQTIISEKDTDTLNLKHRINEEIEEKNNIKTYYNNEFIKLNNEINELEQKLKDDNRSSTMVIEQKIDEIKTLQEEKLSLIQNLSDETTKLDNIIKDLKIDIDTQKNLKLKLKEDYENQLMKLNEKVLNRNNELVELQNNVFEKSEAIEKLHLDLRKEREIKEELSNKYHCHIAQLNQEKVNTEHKLQQKCDESKELQRRLQQNVALFEEFNKEIDELKILNTNLTENLDERNAMLHTLQTQLQDEIHYKTRLKNELSQVHQARAEEFNKLNAEISHLKKDILDKDRIVFAIDLYLKEEKHTNKTLKQDCDKMNEELKKLSGDIAEKEKLMKLLQSKLEVDTKFLKEELCKRDDIIKETKEKLLSENAEKESMHCMLACLKNEKDCLDEDFSRRCADTLQLQAAYDSLKNEKECLYEDLNQRSAGMLQLQADYEKLSVITKQNNQLIDGLEKSLEKEKEKYSDLENNFDTQTSGLMAKLNETEKAIKELNTKYRTNLEDRELHVQTLQIEVEKLQNIVDKNRHDMNKIIKENEVLVEKLNEEIAYRNNFEKEYQNQCAVLNNVTTQLNKEIVLKDQEISALKKEVESLSNIVGEKCEEFKLLEERLQHEAQASAELLNNKNSEIDGLQKTIDEVNSLATGLELELKKEIANKVQAIVALQQENEQLHFAIEEDNSNHEILLKDKDIMIEKLEERVKITSIQLESIRKDYEDSTLMWEKLKVEMRENLQAKDNQVINLKQQVTDLMKNLEENIIAAEDARKDLKKQIDDVIGASNDADLKRKDQIIDLVAKTDQYESKLIDIEQMNIALSEQLESEKAIHDAIESEKNLLAKHNEDLIEELLNERSAYRILNEEKKALLSEKAILAQEVLEEKSVRQIIEQEKLAITTEKQLITQQLNEVMLIKNTLMAEKECLKQQLVEEMSIKELAEKEKDNFNVGNELLEQKLCVEYRIRDDLELEKNNLIREKNGLIQELNSLNIQLIEESSAKDLLQKEKVQLIEILETEKLLRGEIFNEKECLLDENESLKHNVIELKAIQDTLVNDKEILNIEKETLLKSLHEEKAARDEIENEKQSVVVKLNELRDKLFSELDGKQDELQQLTVEFKNLKTEYKKHEDVVDQISSVLTTGLEQLLHNINKEDIGNEMLQKLKLITVEKGVDIPFRQQCDLLINIAHTLTTELSLRKSLEKALELENTALNELKDIFEQKEIQVYELQTEVKRLEQVIHENKVESNASLISKERDLQELHLNNQSLNNELNDVKVQLEVKVHSLKEKLIDNENLTDKLKKTYECQIDNLNMMVTKLTGYLKDKTVELETLRKEKERLQRTVDDTVKVIKCLGDEVKSQKQSQDKLISDFESERLVLTNMVTVTESVMEDQKVSLNNVISEHLKANQILEKEKRALQELVDSERQSASLKIQEKDTSFEAAFKELSDLRKENEILERDMKKQKDEMFVQITTLEEDLDRKTSRVEALEIQHKDLTDKVMKYKDDVVALEDKINELKIKKDSLEFELLSEIDKLTKVLKGEFGKNDKLKTTLQEKLHTKIEIRNKVKVLSDLIIGLVKENKNLEQEKNEQISMVEKVKADFAATEVKAKEEIEKLSKDNVHLVNIIDENKKVISNLEQLIQHELEQNQKIREDTANDKLNLENKCSLLQEYQIKAEKHLEERDREIALLKESVDTVNSNCAKHWNSIIKTYQLNAEKLEEEVETLKTKLNEYEHDLKEKDDIMSRVIREKDTVISTFNMELVEERAAKDKYKSELELKAATVYELKQKLEEMIKQAEVLEILRNENEEMIKAVGQRETFAVVSQDKSLSQKHWGQVEKDVRDHHQVSTPTSDLTHSSTESFKTITDLEKIIHDKNRTITTLQSDITYMKTLMAESENKLLDVTRELEVTKENCEQLSNQLKKIVQQKNEEISELKKQLNRMSVTENRATQIIKVSAKYQTIILKRIAEIKSNTILKELTNFGNTSNTENELRRSLNSGAVTMEDLENFLETTDRHLKRCSEKQLAFQKERDRLIEVNRINESEIINLKKFLTELSISFKTFSSVKELYVQKLSRIVSVQRTVRREILNLDGLVTDTMMCKLERGYAAVMQDLSECAMNLERWVERYISRTISHEKIKQAFTSDDERTSLAPTALQNASLEVQLEELGNSFQKLLEEVARAQKGDGAKDTQSVTVMEVRAEYEDKLNRMKAKMKQLYQEQIAVFKDKQKEEIATLERELLKAREKLAESSRMYEEHIRALTTELWSVGEKFLMKKDEADWLRKKQRSGSLMSLQHVHSSGLAPPPPEELPRPSDTHSLRSLPVHCNREKRGGRGLHMSDEEGEVFDNRFLKDLAATPRRESLQPGQRLSELRWRNSLCPPHLKSSYPAETQFTAALNEEDIKCAATANGGGKQQRKEVGITAYKKPGPPTPSKQAGRLSATDSELRESLRADVEPHPLRKTSTPSRLRALFRASKNDTEGTPRRRLSNMFRKK